MSRAHLEDLRCAIVEGLRSLVGGRTLLLYGAVSRSYLLTRYLADAGALQVLTLPSGIGDHGGSVSARFQRLNDELLVPSSLLEARLASLDPRRECLIYGGSSVSAACVDGRRVLGARLPAWSAWETKRAQSVLTADQPGYSPEYVPFRSGCSPDDLSQYLADRLPCVAAGDPTKSIGMGADYVYLLSGDSPLSVVGATARILTATCDGVRVAPLTPGTPVTYYGFLSARHQVVCGPVEALVGFRRDTGKVTAPGVLCPVAESEPVLGQASRCLARLLTRVRDTTGYRGAFGVDGCLTSDGLVVHEINLRMCAGFSLLSRLLDERISLAAIDVIIRDGRPEVGGLILESLGEFSNTLCQSAEVKLWEDPALEADLRQRLSGVDPENLEGWKALVRAQTLAGHIPFYEKRSRPRDPTLAPIDRR